MAIAFRVFCWAEMQWVDLEYAQAMEAIAFAVFGWIPGPLVANVERIPKDVQA